MGKTVSTVFVDLDGFKQVNDQHGHDEGNRCLEEVIAAISIVVVGNGLGLGLLFSRVT
jgi:diguanylate cyclase (GGDEF)-like protein